MIFNKEMCTSKTKNDWSDEEDLPLSVFVKRKKLILLDVSQYKCDECGWIFTTKAFLKRHQNLYNKSHFYYPCCGQDMKHHDNILDHSCTTNKNCNEEKDCALPSDSYGIDCISENENSPIETSSSNSSEESEREKPFKCSNCPLSYYKLYRLQMHEKKFEGKNHNFICAKCKRHFLTTEHLAKHPCILAVSKKFLCSCFKKFSNMSKFKKHIGKSRPFFCCKCKQACTSRSNLINHIRTHTKEKPFSCEYCGQSFAVKATMKLHIRKHTKEKPYHCSNCSYSCATKTNLHLHEEIHKVSGERRFLCNYCAATFTRQHHLNRHMKKHSQESASKHLCRVCGKLFADASYLNNHLKLHYSKTGLKRKCLTCSEEFPKLEAYRLHLKTGHFQFACVYCSKVFLNKCALQKHILVHNNLSSGQIIPHI